ncbi:MAG: ATP-binding protein [Aggregatilineales bacterium]
MAPLKKLVSIIGTLWIKLVEPPKAINDPDKRFHIRAVNSLLVVFTILALVITSLRLIVSDESSYSRAQLVGIVAFALIFIVYLYYVINRREKYDYVVPVIFGMGFIIITLNILTTPPPHLEILYLIFMPLISTILLTTTGTVIVSIVTLFLAVTVSVTLENQISDVTMDIFAFMLFSQAFIIFATYQRNRLELERRELIVGQEKQRVMHDVIANLSHDLKTPLTIINTGLYLLQRTTDPTRQKEKIDQIQVQAQHLDKIVQDIIKISSLEHDREITLVPIPLHSLLEVCVNRVLPAMQDKRLQFTSTYADEPFVIMVNVDELSSVFINLLSNAVTYTPEGGEIYLMTSREKNSVKVMIRDTGIGIAEEDLPRIFERFYRADKARSIETGGTGLGLAIARHVIALHGGEISSDSVLGEGATFTITLPLTASH